MRNELKVFRVKNQLTQKEIASKLGVSHSAYNLIETGKRNGTIKFWEKLQKEFNLDGGELWNLQTNKI